VWITDGLGRNGKGHQVLKFGPDGKLLLTLGSRNAGQRTDEFNAPSAVVTAPLIFSWPTGMWKHQCAHREVRQDRQVHPRGARRIGTGEIDIPHAIAMDRKGGVVGDRQNNRIQIFDQEGQFLDQWAQFSRPSGIYIDKNDNITWRIRIRSVSNHDGWRRGSGSAAPGQLGDGVHSGSGRKEQHHERGRGGRGGCCRISMVPKSARNG
jgi:hypothetical protein